MVSWQRVAGLCCALSIFASPAAAEEMEMVNAAEWARPREGAALVQLPALASTVARLQARPGSRLELRYPGGDAGILWGEELRAWLVALGVASSRIELIPGSSQADTVELRVSPAGAAVGSP